MTQKLLFYYFSVVNDHFIIENLFLDIRVRF